MKRRDCLTIIHDLIASCEEGQRGLLAEAGTLSTGDEHLAQWLPDVEGFEGMIDQLRELASVFGRHTPTSNPSGLTVQPPRRRFARTRRWTTFCSLFKPLAVKPGWYLREPSEVPVDADAHSIWTVLDPMDGSHFYLAPGVHLVNRMGYVLCANRWGGEADDHPAYSYC